MLLALAREEAEVKVGMPEALLVGQMRLARLQSCCTVEHDGPTRRRR